MLKPIIYVIWTMALLVRSFGAGPTGTYYTKAPLGAMALDGTLYFGIDLGGVPLSESFEIPLQLTHSTVARDGHLRSSWSIVQLQTFICPRPNGLWEYVHQDGRTLYFAGSRFSDSALSIAIQDDTAVVRFRHQPTLTYRTGRLSRLELSDGAVFDVTSKGRHIESIRKVGQSSPDLECKYDAGNRLECLSTSSGMRYTFVYSSGGDLLHVRDDSGAAITFTYKAGLLMSFKARHSPEVSIVWGKLPLFDLRMRYFTLGDRIVESFGGDVYDYTVDGTDIVRKRISSDAIVVSRFDTYTKKLTEDVYAKQK